MLWGWLGKLVRPNAQLWWISGWVCGLATEKVWPGGDVPWWFWFILGFVLAALAMVDKER